MLGRARASVVTVCAALVVLGGCGWLQGSFDNGHTNSNDLETAITAANVSTLVEHTIPMRGDVLLIGDLIVVRGAEGVTAFDRRTCPRSDNSACTPRWTHPDDQIWHAVSDGVRIFLGTLHGVVALDLGGNVLWQWAETLKTSPGPGTSSGGLVVHDGKLLQSLDVQRTDGKYDNQVAFFASAGCGSPTCAPRILDLDKGTPYSVGPALLAGKLGYLVTADRLRAIDLTTGVESWRADVRNTNGLVARDGRIRVKVQVFGLDAILTFDAAGTSGCGGTPRVCAPLDIQPAAFVMSAASHDHIFGMGYDGLGVHVTWNDPKCTGCAPVATSTDIGSASPISNIGVGGGVVYALGRQSINAFDEHAVAGCTGSSPKTCAPLWTADLGDVQSMGPRIFGGRVYTVTPNTELIHVFSLPGDVS